MRRSPLRTAVLACLLVTAGCLGFVGEGTEPATPTTESLTPERSTATATPTATSTVSPTPERSTATATPTATSTPSLTPLAIAPPSGAGDLWTGSPGRSAGVHEATLRNTSFTARISRVRIKRGEVTLRVSGIVRYDGNGTVYYNYTRIDRGRGMAPRTEIELWSNDTTARRALTNANTTIIDEVRPILTVPTFADRVELYLRLFRTGVSGYSRLRGEPIVRVSGSRLDRSGKQFWWLLSRLDFREVRGAEFSAEVTDDRLRRYRVELVGSEEAGPRRGGSVLLEEELSFTDVGTTTISRPEWVTARNESSSG